MRHFTTPWILLWSCIFRIVIAETTLNSRAASSDRDIQSSISDSLRRRSEIGNGTALRVVCIGDSITQGYGSSDDNGYRVDLYNRLKMAGNEVEFIGTQTYGNSTSPANHFEGYSGFRITEIEYQVLGKGILLQQPNVIVLMAGTNDLFKEELPNEPYSEALNRLETFLENILCICPEAVVLLAKIPQIERTGAKDRAELYDAGIPDIVSRAVAKGKKVQLVNQQVVGGAYLAPDGIHPNNIGYVLMAAKWYSALAAVPSGWISQPQKLDTIPSGVRSGCLAQVRATCLTTPCRQDDFSCWWRCFQAQHPQKTTGLDSQRVLS